MGNAVGSFAKASSVDVGVVAHRHIKGREAAQKVVVAPGSLGGLQDPAIGVGVGIDAGGTKGAYAQCVDGALRKPLDNSRDRDSRVFGGNLLTFEDHALRGCHSHHHLCAASLKAANAKGAFLGHRVSIPRRFAEHRSLRVTGV